MLNKIDDNIANKCSDAKLLEMGLIYGDLLSFREFFPDKCRTVDDTMKTYAERSEELKKKLKRTHTSRIDTINRPVTVKSSYGVTFGLKCYEKTKYTLKINQGFTEQFDREATYNDIHEVCRTYFKIPSKTNKPNFCDLGLHAKFQDPS